MTYGHLYLIAATVMTLGVCQVHSSISSLSVLTSASRGPSAIAVLLVEHNFTTIGLIFNIITLHYNSVQVCHTVRKITSLK